MSAIGQTERATQNRVIALIQSLGYRLWWHLPRMFNPDNFRGDRENLFGNIVSVNMLCLPQETQTVVDLPEIKTPGDDWRKAGKARGIPLFMQENCEGEGRLLRHIGDVHLVCCEWLLLGLCGHSQAA